MIVLFYKNPLKQKSDPFYFSYLWWIFKNVLYRRKPLFYKRRYCFVQKKRFTCTI